RNVTLPFLSIRSLRTLTPAPTRIIGPDGLALSRASKANPRRHAFPGPVRSHLVVVGDEPIDLGLELGDRADGWLTGQERLHRLVEALDLAAGLRMVGTGVAELDPEREQLGLHHVGSSPVPGRVDAAVVGQQRRRQPPALTCGPEDPKDLWCRRGPKDLGRHGQAGVVV